MKKLVAFLFTILIACMFIVVSPVGACTLCDNFLMQDLAGNSAESVDQAVMASGLDTLSYVLKLPIGTCVVLRTQPYIYSALDTGKPFHGYPQLE